LIDLLDSIVKALSLMPALGRHSGSACFLSMKGTVPEELCTKLRSCSDMELLRSLVKLVAKAESVSEFEAELDNLLK
jgi:hypothetical protein